MPKSNRFMLARHKVEGGISLASRLCLTASRCKQLSPRQYYDLLEQWRDVLPHTGSHNVLASPVACTQYVHRSPDEARRLLGLLEYWAGGKLRQPR